MVVVVCQHGGCCSCGVQVNIGIPPVHKAAVDEFILQLTYKS